MNDMSYKGYTAKIEYSAEDSCLVGHILGIQDIVGFHGDSVAEMRLAFEEAVDDYLDMCAKTDKKPQKPYSGKIMLRVSPELHARLASKAQTEGKSLNRMVTDTLNQVVGING
jgi:predicted HicB family RNase H-like nuclease